jgi:hypothetical protein
VVHSDVHSYERLGDGRKNPTSLDYLSREGTSDPAAGNASPQVRRIRESIADLSEIDGRPIDQRGNLLVETLCFRDGLFVERGNPRRGRVEKSIELSVRQSTMT